ncbi:MAG: DNA-directed RNA polymerase subunit D [Candidatus Helarchaeota archaeon]
MEIQIIEKYENILTLLIEGSVPSLVNGLRRIMLAQVPTLAIEDVWIVKNTSSLYDRNIAQRLGLIPLKSEMKDFNFPDKCECEGVGCSLCQVGFTIDKEAENENVVVYSSDLKSEDPKIIPAEPKIFIVELYKGQKLVLEAYAKMGIGKTHVKWQAVSTASFKYVPIFEIDQEKCKKCETAPCIDFCPRNIIIKNEKNEIVIDDKLNCSLCRECEKMCENNAIKVCWDEKTFLFYLESNGQLPPDQIVLKSCEIFKKKVTDFLEKIEIQA